MGTINAGLFSSATDLWSTPQDFYDTLDNEFHFTLDACALPENAKCSRYYTPEQNGLVQPWKGVVWCNPPYGRQIGDWVRKAWVSSLEGSTVVMLLPARTDTRWFHGYIYKKDNVEIRFLRGRLKFGGSKNSAPFPSMTVVFWPYKQGGTIYDLNGFSIVRIGEFYELTTPYMDKDNDHIQIYVHQNSGNSCFITDDGATVSQLELSGISVSKVKKHREKLLRIAGNFGITVNGNDLEIQAAETDCLVKIHILIQAILTIYMQFFPNMNDL